VKKYEGMALSIFPAIQECHNIINTFSVDDEIFRQEVEKEYRLISDELHLFDKHFISSFVGAIFDSDAYSTIDHFE